MCFFFSSSSSSPEWQCKTLRLTLWTCLGCFLQSLQWHLALDNPSNAPLFISALQLVMFHLYYSHGATFHHTFILAWWRTVTSSSRFIKPSSDLMYVFSNTVVIKGMFTQPKNKNSYIKTRMYPDLPLVHTGCHIDFGGYVFLRLREPSAFCSADASCVNWLLHGDHYFTMWERLCYVVNWAGWCLSWKSWVHFTSIWLLLCTSLCAV